MRKLKNRTGVVTFVLLAFVGSACGSNSPDTVKLNIDAAASLGPAFTQLGDEFDSAHPEIALRFNFASSSELAQQILEDAPVDIFASADAANMAKVEETGLLIAPSTIFATNRLEIVVEKGNPFDIRSIADLAKPDVLFVTASPEVPIGKYTTEALEKAGVVLSPVSFEKDVSAILSKVRLGEADAGIVYHSTIVAADGAVESVSIPDEFNVVARYPIGILATSKNATAARLFLDFVLSDRGREILTEQGFTAP